MSTEVHTLSGAYALDALSAEEAADFRRHLRECEACHQEVRELQHVAALMGAAEAAAPSAGLRERVLTVADRTPQLPPPATTLPARPVSSTASPVVDPSRQTDQAGQTGQTDRAGRADSTDTGAAEVTPLRRGQRWFRPLAAAAAAVVIAGGGVTGVRALLDEPSGPGTGQGVTNAAVAAVFDAGDARIATVSTEIGGRLTVGVSAARDEMAVDTRELPPLDGDHVYQIWSIQDGQAISAAVLEDPASGAAMPLPGRASQVAITVEPSPGSEQPTTQPIIQVDPYTV